MQQHMYEIITGQLGMSDTCDPLVGEGAPRSCFTSFGEDARSYSSSQASSRGIALQIAYRVRDHPLLSKNALGSFSTDTIEGFAAINMSRTLILFIWVLRAS